MIQVSLDNEPPPMILGKKEVSKRRNKNLPQWIFSIKKKKNIPKESKNTNLEDKIKYPVKNISSLENYSAFERSPSGEKTTSSSKKIKLSDTNFTEGNWEIKKINYLKIHEENSIENTTNLSLYFRDSEYNFIFSQTFIKYDNKEKKYYLESKEKQEKEPICTLPSFEEGKIIEEKEIKWDATAYN